MVRLNKIYTRTGDDGTTGLVTGTRIDKDDLRIEAFGCVDETNAAVGLARGRLDAPENLDGAAEDIDALLARVQNDLFDLGADLATPLAGDEEPGKALRVQEHQVTRLEQEIDRLNAGLEPLTSFILPGGKPGVAELHLARTVCRRAERVIVSLGKVETVNRFARLYSNRLSDLLFVTSRFVNDGGRSDVLWIPGQNR